LITELRKSIESIYPENGTIYIGSTSEEIGSQFELDEAYKGSIGPVLDLEISFASRAALKLRQPGDVESISGEVTRRFCKGSWSVEEVERFVEGVRMYTWGKWTQIAKIVQTRNATAVRTFSLSREGSQYNVFGRIEEDRVALNQTALGFSLLLKGMGRVAEERYGLRDQGE
jgi:hypothetical protein